MGQILRSGIVFVMFTGLEEFLHQFPYFSSMFAFQLSRDLDTFPSHHCLMSHPQYSWRDHVIVILCELLFKRVFLKIVQCAALLRRASLRHHLNGAPNSRGASER